MSPKTFFCFCFFEVQMKPLKRVFCKLFGKVEFVWCHVIKCDSSPAEGTLTPTLVGLHAVENQEPVVPCRMEVFCVLTCWKCCCARVCVYAGRASQQQFRPSFYVTYFSQSLSCRDKEHACAISVEVMILTAVFCYNCNINRATDS